ncbi:MAG: Crp/Fnr family transcriptional regulator [Clostridiales bacterium GWF2_38_85]|nr:MAG: Crp/Fnr family transcriptional regulator [Clostridiales bacterium GWF2_38_85]HBL83372.1 Crp/Fnr family transcriptional regulator [Clostridiales bacterium]
MSAHAEDFTSVFAEHFEFWDKLSQSEKDLFNNNSSLIKYQKGTIIQNGENDCVGVILVKSGVLRTYILSEEGRDITLYRLYKGDVCILSASCIIRSITFDVHIEADEECEIVAISVSMFTKMTQNNIYVECFVYKTATDRFSDVMWAMQQILFMSFDKRLATFLTDELSKSEDDTIKLTHEQIAKYMGSAREVVTRMLKCFADDRIVELSRGSIKVIDKKKLRSLT